MAVLFLLVYLQWFVLFLAMSSLCWILQASVAFTVSRTEPFSGSQCNLKQTYEVTYEAPPVT